MLVLDGKELTTPLHLAITYSSENTLFLHLLINVLYRTFTNAMLAFIDCEWINGQKLNFDSHIF
jgi:hypothetical protein